MTEPVLAVGAVVKDRAGRLLLIRRGHPPGEGLWSLPGGRLEEGEALSEAVSREVREETGLAVRVSQLVGWVEREGPSYHFVILDFEADLVGGDAPRAGDDAAEAAWFAPEELEGLPLVDGLAEFLRSHDVT